MTERQGERKTDRQTEQTVASGHYQREQKTRQTMTNSSHLAAIMQPSRHQGASNYTAHRKPNIAVPGREDHQIRRQYPACARDHDGTQANARKSLLGQHRMRRVGSCMETRNKAPEQGIQVVQAPSLMSIPDISTWSPRWAEKFSLSVIDCTLSEGMSSGTEGSTLR